MAASRIAPIAPDVWAKLEAARPQGAALTARLAIPSEGDRVLAAVDSENRRHILIRLHSLEDGIDDSDSRGVAVATRQLHVGRETAMRHIDITCQDASGYEVLDLIGSEISSRIANRTQQPADSVRSVLAKWRRFWGRIPKNVLSRSEQVGLFAELWFLRFWLLDRVGIGEAVLRWCGPFGARHDFEWSGRSVEVKGTTQVRGVVHRINGIDQLSPPESGNLLFFSLQVREERGALRTLAGLVDDCRSVVKSDDEAAARFESALANIGYSDAHREEYDNLRFRPVREALYRVEGNFPRLTVSQFQPSLPSGVESVEYDINLAGQDALVIASSSKDDFPLD